MSGAPEQRGSVFADLPDPPAIAPSEEFLRLAGEHEIAFDEGDIERLGRFLALLAAASERANLTAIRDPEQAWVHHIFDSLTLISMLGELGDGARVIDVGAGGGLPGVPLAITMSGLEFTLLEATGKKAEFLALAIERLGLGNARVVQERAERAGQTRGIGGHREAYDAAIARALGPIRVASELTVPLVKQHGLILLVKGERADEELADAAHALRELRAVHAGTIQTPTSKVVCLSKQSATPRVYPRRDGEPKRKPL